MTSQKLIIAVRRSWSARLGTTKDARRYRQKTLPVHRKATFGFRRRRRSEFAGISTTANLQRVTSRCDGSRSCHSCREIRHADRQPRCRTGHVGPLLLRWIYASVFSVATIVNLLLFLDRRSVDAVKFPRRPSLDVSKARHNSSNGSGRRQYRPRCN